MWGVSEAAPGQKPIVVTGKMAGKRDPGYWETSRMLLESGLCLALQVCHVCTLQCKPRCLALLCVCVSGLLHSECLVHVSGISHLLHTLVSFLSAGSPAADDRS